MGQVRIMGLELEELESLFREWNQLSYRARQVFEWVHRHAVTNPDQMTNIPGQLREELRQKLLFATAREVERARAEDGTVKFLLELEDGLHIETVLMRQSHGNTACVSSQVGCRWRCPFCASGKRGLSRNLEPGEMVEQVLRARRLLCRDGQDLDNLVLMGMGEPLDNLENCLKFVRIVRAPEGVNLGVRRISISTVGIVPGIRRLAEEEIPITLSVSLHAPNDQLRRRLLPAARVHRLGELMEACRDFFKATGRRVTFEYIMIQEVNDLLEQARELGSLLENMQSHVNLIPLNPVAQSGWRASTPARVEAFARVLRRRGRISVTIRRPRGLGVEAACGQLAGRRAEGVRRGNRK